MDPERLLRELGCRLFERGWLSSNNVVFEAGAAGPHAVVDTGYASHAAQTVALVEQGLEGAPLELIVNTHLHSDHCGGNAALQRRWPAAETFVPADCYEAVDTWDDARLTFELTDQRCERFRADGALVPGSLVPLGSCSWEVHSAPGHDPTAIMLFEPVSRTLISGDALWERRLAIVFPELTGQSGFEACARTLDAIERLQPALVLPGHGAAFGSVPDALRASRARIDAFARDPARHARHAVRALLMFHVFEVGQTDRSELVRWLQKTPITSSAGAGAAAAEEAVASLVADGVLIACGETLRPAQ